MDWERKFSSIVHETETNLAKVKERLGCSHTSSNTPNHSGYANVFFDRSSHIHSPNNTFAKSFPPAGAYNSSLNSNFLMPSAPNQFMAASGPPIYSVPGTAPLQGTSGGLSLDQSPGIMVFLADKLEAQTQCMEQLNRSVRQLEEEKRLYGKHVCDLQEELGSLTRRMTEKGVDVATERKIEMWKRDVMAELQLMQSQIQLHRCNDKGSLSSSSILRELSETKRHITDECDSLRLEVGNLKIRLVKLEENVACVVSNNQDLERRHDRIELNLRDVVDTQHSTVRDVTRTMAERCHDKAEINELKCSLQTIHEKLDQVQGQVLRDTEIKYRPSGYDCKKTRSSDMQVADVISPISTDLDYTTDSTDMLDELSLSPKQSKNRVNSTITLSEDDLDEDLTTDDLLSSCLDMRDLK